MRFTASGCARRPRRRSPHRSTASACRPTSISTRIHEPDEWRRIPILGKEELRALSPREFMADFNIAPRPDIQEYWRSGGSTGKPLFYPRTFRDMEFMFEGFRRGIQLAGVKPGDTAHISYPLGIHPVGHVSARVCQQMGVGVNWAGSGASTPSAVQVELIDQMQPTVWMGMSGYALHLANLAEAKGFDLKKSSVKKVLCAAEPISDAKRAKIEGMWGATLFDGFGMTEMCMMGAEDDTARRLPHVDRHVLSGGSRPRQPRAGRPRRGRRAGFDRAVECQRHALRPLEFRRPGGLALDRAGRRRLPLLPAPEARPPDRRLLQGARRQHHPRRFRGFHVRHGRRAGLQVRGAGRPGRARRPARLLRERSRARTQMRWRPSWRRRSGRSSN